MPLSPVNSLSPFSPHDDSPVAVVVTDGQTDGQTNQVQCVTSTAERDRRRADMIQSTVDHDSSTVVVVVVVVVDTSVASFINDRCRLRPPGLSRPARADDDDEIKTALSSLGRSFGRLFVWLRRPSRQQ